MRINPNISTKKLTRHKHDIDSSDDVAMLCKQHSPRPGFRPLQCQGPQHYGGQSRRPAHQVSVSAQQGTADIAVIGSFGSDKTVNLSFAEAFRLF